jgi:hypothetical protein
VAKTDNTIEYGEERKDVWHIMSGMFLDTAFEEDDVNYVARSLAATSFSTEELISIMQNEVAPILHTNLMCVAGQWGCFDRNTEVAEPIIKRLNYLKSVSVWVWAPFRKLSLWFYMSDVGPDWKKVLAVLKEIRNESKS